MCRLTQVAFASSHDMCSPYDCVSPIKHLLHSIWVGVTKKCSPTLLISQLSVSAILAVMVVMTSVSMVVVMFLLARETPP